MPLSVVNSNAVEQTVIINEVCTQNKASLLDSYGSASDWIELYNSSDSSISLGGWTLADSGSSWTFPAGAEIAAGEYMILFASKSVSTETEYHTGFGLSKSGDSLTLSDHTGTVQQELTIPALAEDRTYGLLSDSGEWAEMAATPGIENEFSVAAPQFSLPSGFYNSSDTNILTLAASSDVYYTTDGSDPTTSATAIPYEGDILLQNRSYEENIWSNYEHTDNSPYSINISSAYSAPDYPIEKANVIRAAAKNGDVWSNVVTNTYFVLDSERLAYYREIPVVSLVTDGENLFNKDTGIYVVGQQYIDWKNSSSYIPNKSEWDTDNVTNFFSKGKEWERDATISLFQNGEMSFVQDFGIRIKGASTRNSTMKSFNVYARSEYGDSKLNFDLIPDNVSADDSKQIDKYDSFSLRAVSWVNRFRDQIVQMPLKDVCNMSTIDRKKAIVFLNGEYWGLYEISEKISDFYIQSNYGIADTDVAMIKDNELEEGTDVDLKEFNDIINYAKNNDMSVASNYVAVESEIDLDSMIDHFALCLYTGMWDWPNHNYFAWRSNGSVIEGNPYSDGKWRFGTFDFDYTCGLDYSGGINTYSYDSFARLGQNHSHIASAFVSLLENSAFKERFVKRFCDYANIIYEPSRMTAYINSLQEQYIEYYTDSELRWNSAAEPTDAKRASQQSYLENEIGNIAEFFEQRQNYAIEDMMNFCGVEGNMCTLSLHINGEGEVLVNGLPVNDTAQIACRYPVGTEITVTARENTMFLGWSGAVESAETEITFTIDSDMELIADFGDSVICGDVNADGALTIADVVLLQKWLLCVPDTTLADWKSGDLCEDERLDVFDLCLMKRELLKNN